MMGRLTSDQAQLFYEFRLEDRIPASHLLRQIDAVLDLGQLHQLLAPFYSHTGRPSIDPELMPGRGHFPRAARGSKATAAVISINTRNFTFSVRAPSNQ